jgi:hypothetical protein
MQHERLHVLPAVAMAIGSSLLARPMLASIPALYARLGGDREYRGMFEARGELAMLLLFGAFILGGSLGFAVMRARSHAAIAALIPGGLMYGVFCGAFAAIYDLVREARPFALDHVTYPLVAAICGAQYGAVYSFLYVALLVAPLTFTIAQARRAGRGIVDDEASTRAIGVGWGLWLLAIDAMSVVASIQMPKRICGTSTATECLEATSMDPLPYCALATLGVVVAVTLVARHNRTFGVGLGAARCAS